MQIAARNGSVAMLEMLLQYGGPLDSKGNSGDTLYHLACLDGHVEVIDWLFQRGLSLEVVDIQGQSPLHVAARRCEMEALLRLIDLGLDFEAQDYSGRSPFDCVPVDESAESTKIRAALSALVTERISKLLVK